MLKKIIIITSTLLMLGCETQTSEWQPFNTNNLEESLNSGRPTLVQITADWCANCMHIENTVLNSPEAVEVYDKMNIALIRADSTNDNPAIGAWLDQNDIPNLLPIYVYYPAGEPNNPLMLFDGLTKQDIKDLNRI